ncbi:cation:proton antiporter [Streptomyces sp. NPDC007088]|uniref:cation:proton antiporter n=1 Tax=Streptomyces sp. NPDC007088 TaxID=3364773 RepID=UPI0036879035
MQPTLIAVVGIVAVVLVAAFSGRLGLAAPLSLVVFGAALGFVPGVPHLVLEPEWVLAGVLPPLLYSASVTMPAQDFRRNFKPITGLAVFLVVVTTLGAGWLFHALLPGLDRPTAFALGAVISPTDAVAATSVGRRLGLPGRLLTVLEGEGLVNDATSLTLLRSAVAATSSTVSLWWIGGAFLYSVAVAIGVGAGVGLLNVRVRSLLPDTVLNTAVSFVVPFVAYLPAEELHASGVLSVVVTGLITGHQSPRFLPAQDRISEATNWRTLAFLLESAIFLLMGLSLEPLLDAVRGDGLSVGRGVLIGLAASGLVILARIVFVAPLVAGLHQDARRAAKAEPEVERLRKALHEVPELKDGHAGRRARHRARRITQAGADLDFRLTQTLGRRGGTVLAWAGMRGAVTLAAAQTLPADTPARPQLILVAFVVAVTTLLLQGLTLPTVIRLVKVPGDDPERLREEYGRLLEELSQAAESALDAAVRAEDPPEREVVDKVRSDSLLRAGLRRGAPEEGGEEEWRQRRASRREQYRLLRLDVLAAEHDTLQAARSTGVYSSRVITRAQRALDLEEARLRQLAEKAEEA